MAALALSVAAVLTPTIASTGSSPLIEVRSEAGLLRVKAVDAPFGEVLAAVTRETGVRFDVDEKLAVLRITIDTDAAPIERAIARLPSSISPPAGHVMRYAAGAEGKERLVAVTILPGGTDEPGAPPPETVVDDRARKLEAAGASPESAERAIALVEEARSLAARSVEGRLEDLPPDLQGRLQQMLESGVPEEMAVHKLLVERRYQEILHELSQVPGGPALLLDVPGGTRP